MRLKYVYILILLLLTPCGLYAQSEPQRKTAAKESLRNVSKAIEDGEPDEKVAERYEKLAKDLSESGDHAKAEDYLNRAKKIYERLKDKEKIATVDRELAKVQEAQNKINEAVVSYNAAMVNSEDKIMQQVNAMDMNRASNYSNPAIQSGYARRKINILSTSDNSEEKALAFQQMAQVNRDLDNTPAAIENLEMALLEVKDKPAVSMQIKQDIASTYAADNQLGKAIEIKKDLIAEARRENNPKAEVAQLQNLSTTFIEANKQTEGIATLQEAYNIAISNKQTLGAKSSLELLVEQYKKIKQPQKALDAYADFINKLDNLIKSDSTLIDEKHFQVQENKILLLEKERALKDELIAKKNTFNYVLIAAIFLILIFLFFIARALYSIKKKNKRIALQSLRREMNPHFIFNSLNSVNQFIAQNNELEANKYLSSYSKLMRNVMENSNKDFISLTSEIEQLKEYLDLEYMRFQDKFTYKIDIEETIDSDSVFIPNMLIQPQLENAIWHGLRYKESIGLLILTIKQENEKLLIVINDNGIGLTKSLELKTKHQKEHNSRGLTNTKERINLLNSLYNTNISIDIKEKSINESGVIVTLEFPLILKHR